MSDALPTLYDRAEALAAEGRTLTQIAVELGLGSRSQVAGILRRGRKAAGQPTVAPAGQELLGQVGALDAKGLTAAEIAARLGIESRDKVAGMIRKGRLAAGLPTVKAGRGARTSVPRPAKRAAPAPRVPAPEHRPAAMVQRPERTHVNRPQLIPSAIPAARRADPRPDWMRDPAPENDLGDLAGRPTLREAGLGQCRFPIWADGPPPRAERQFVCGRPTIEGESWCPSCARRVFARGREAA